MSLAMASNELAQRELSNLTKNKLIEIILTRKIPGDVKLSDSTLNVMEFLKIPNFVDANSDFDVQEQNITYKNMCIEKDLKCANYEIECQKRVIREMERSIVSQNKTIESQDYLLKILKKENNKTQICDVAVPSKMSLKSEETVGKSKEIVSTQNLGMTVASAQTLDGEIPKKYADVVSGRNKVKERVLNTIISENKWNVAGRKRPRRRMVVGVGNASQSETKVKGVPKLIDLHVYRIHPDTTAEDLADMLRPHFEEVVIEAMESKNPDVYSSFKVTIFQDNFEKAMDATSWPKNSCIRRFLNIRKRNDLGRT